MKVVWRDLSPGRGSSEPRQLGAPSSSATTESRVSGLLLRSRLGHLSLSLVVCALGPDLEARSWAQARETRCGACETRCGRSFDGAGAGDGRRATRRRLIPPHSRPWVKTVTVPKRPCLRPCGSFPLRAVPGGGTTWVRLRRRRGRRSDSLPSPPAICLPISVGKGVGSIPKLGVWVFGLCGAARGT